MPSLATQLERSLRVVAILEDEDVQAACLAFVTSRRAGGGGKGMLDLVDAILTADEHYRNEGNVPTVCEFCSDHGFVDNPERTRTPFDDPMSVGIPCPECPK